MNNELTNGFSFSALHSVKYLGRVHQGAHTKVFKKVLQLKFLSYWTSPGIPYLVQSVFFSLVANEYNPGWIIVSPLECCASARLFVCCVTNSVAVFVGGGKHYRYILCNFVTLCSVLFSVLQLVFCFGFFMDIVKETLTQLCVFYNALKATVDLLPYGQE